MKTSEEELKRRANARSKKWRDENPERTRNNIMDWRVANIDAYRKYQREYHRTYRALQKLKKEKEDGIQND